MRSSAIILSWLLYLIYYIICSSKIITADNTYYLFLNKFMIVHNTPWQLIVVLYIPREYGFKQCQLWKRKLNFARRSIHNILVLTHIIMYAYLNNIYMYCVAFRRLVENRTQSALKPVSHPYHIGIMIIFYCAKFTLNVRSRDVTWSDRERNEEKINFEN